MARFKVSKFHYPLMEQNDWMPSIEWHWEKAEDPLELSNENFQFIWCLCKESRRKNWLSNIEFPNKYSTDKYWNSRRGFNAGERRRFYRKSEKETGVIGWFWRSVLVGAVNISINFIKTCLLCELLIVATEKNNKKIPRCSIKWRILKKFKNLEDLSFLVLALELCIFFKNEWRWPYYDSILFFDALELSISSKLEVFFKKIDLHLATVSTNRREDFWISQNLL